MYGEKDCTRFASVRYIHDPPCLGTMKVVPWLLQLLQWYQSESFSHFINASTEGRTAPPWCISHFIWCGHSYAKHSRIRMFQPWWTHISKCNFLVWKRHWCALWRERPLANSPALMHPLPIPSSTYELHLMAIAVQDATEIFHIL